MFKLESQILKREFKITDGNFVASQILNTASGMSFVPDGNGSEFIIHFVDGSEFSSKGLPVTDSSWREGKLCFDFDENMGVSVTMMYWVHDDGKSICKQLVVNQHGGAAIDYIVLENIGIVNSKTHFSVSPVEGSEIPEYHTILGQPFYVDSLFFGCEFPATDNRIVHGLGRIRYYVGKYVGGGFKCPVTVMGGAADNTLIGVRKAFFDYIDFISTDCNLRFQYNSWYDYMRDITEENILSSFRTVHDKLAEHNAPALDSYAVDDGWPDTKAGFWSFNKKFPNGMKNIAKLCKDMDSTFGIWLGPRGGYNGTDRIAKRMQRKGNAFLNKESRDICVASTKYIDKLTEFFVNTSKEYDIDYWKLDGFCLKPCQNEKHDHAVGGNHDMYFVTDMWQKWIAAFETLREAKPDMWINMTCYVNVSPWWLQWVNSMWLQNSNDIGFADNYDDQPQVEAELTYRDGRYFDCLCRRALQFPLKAIYNHEPIYGNTAKIKYSDEEFEKYIYWCAIRGQALNEIYISHSMMNDSKWDSLAQSMQFQKDNYHILKNATYIGGDPVDNNIYGYISWADNGEGIIALRNPSREKTPLTLTLNKLMNTPEDMKDERCIGIYNKSTPDTDTLYSYGDKIDMTLRPFEVVILKFTK
ncbi:MAG: hypothetical protein PUE73_00385 [Eubacteriales bacterium]|nr:hypothetical protein [Eubacteriales bacterium]